MFFHIHRTEDEIDLPAKLLHIRRVLYNQFTSFLPESASQRLTLGNGLVHKTVRRCGAGSATAVTSNHGCWSSRETKRWPTMPVAPTMPTRYFFILFPPINATKNDANKVRAVQQRKGTSIPLPVKTEKRSTFVTDAGLFTAASRNIPRGTGVSSACDPLAAGRGASRAPPPLLLSPRASDLSKARYEIINNIPPCPMLVNAPRRCIVCACTKQCDLWYNIKSILISGGENRMTAYHLFARV